MYINGKMRRAETIPGMGRDGIEENDGGGEFNYDIFCNFCKCHNVPSEEEVKGGGWRMRRMEEEEEKEEETNSLQM
jgi:hypothetical protein